ncbi:MAG: hypothetical protein WC460_04070 [Patescibacteria group bacterium]
MKKKIHWAIWLVIILIVLFVVLGNCWLAILCGYKLTADIIAIWKHPEIITICKILILLAEVCIIPMCILMTICLCKSANKKKLLEEFGEWEDISE